MSDKMWESRKLSVTWPIIVIVTLASAAGCDPDGGTMTFTARPSAPEYAANQRVDITLSLRNGTGSTVRVSPLVEGNLRVVSFRKDGVDVDRRQTPIIFDDDFGSVLLQSLTDLGDGSRQEILWSSATDPVLGGHALQAVEFDAGGEHQATYYSVASPGNYTIAVAYEYAGPDDGSGSVYSDRSQVADVSFVVRP